MSVADRGLQWLPGWRIRELIVSGEISPTEVVAFFLERIDEVDRHLHSFVTVAHEAALAAATALEGKLASGAEPGPLFGIPVAVKDQYPTAGIRTTAGSLTLAQHVPDTDAAVVERLKAADAVIIGKTNTAEFALFWRTRNRVSPETRNPWDPDRSPGGSSGGSAAAVAAGLVPVAIGSDGGGSTRLPSAFCGVLGILPSLGVVSNHGAIGRARLFDRIGPMTRDVRDMAITLNAIAGPDERDPVTTGVPSPVQFPGTGEGKVDGSFLRWTAPTPLAAADPAVTDIVGSSLADLAGLGGRVSEPVEELDLGYLDAFRVISSADRYGLHGKPLYDDPATRGLLTPYAIDMYAQGSAHTAADYATALDIRQRWIGRLHGLFAEFDVLVSPTVGFTAPDAPDDWTWVPPGIGAFTRLANFVGAAALSLPCGTVGGLPVGIQLMGPPGSELRLLRIARALEAAELLEVRSAEPRVGGSA